MAAPKDRRGVRCPQCGDKLIQASAGVTTIRIRGKLEFDKNGTARAQCYWCHTRVELPALRLALQVPEEVLTVTPS